MLGVIDDDLYSTADEVSVQLDPGDTLLLYTDGLGEVENENGEQFETTRLREVLLENTGVTGGELFDVLIDSIRQFGKADHSWDDLTILGIESK
jgi:serine phosphatase RsbU (regulator of sigma subunit)